MNKPYIVVFTGEIVPKVDVDTVKSNLVLSVGLADAKVARLFGHGEVVLKRYATTEEAERLAEKFYQAGAICEVRDTRLTPKNPGAEVGGESSLIRMLRHVTGSGKRSLASKRRQA